MIKTIISESIKIKEKVANKLIPDIEKAIGLIIECYSNDGKLLICGNGGSAADAQHMEGEMVGRFKMERKALPCVALNTNSSSLTALSNDYGVESVFERQVEALGRKKDILIGISTSGNSKNVVKAMIKAKKMGIKTIGLVGSGGGQIKELADLSLVVDSNDTPRIQEAHIMIIHIICELVEKSLFKENKTE